MASEYYAALGEPESFVQAFVKSWQQRNEQYFRAATMYAANVLSYYKRTKGAQAKQAALRAYVAAVRGQGAAAVEDWLAQGGRTETCRQFRARVDAGLLDMGPSHPLYKEATELLKSSRHFKEESRRPPRRSRRRPTAALELQR